MWSTSTESRPKFGDTVMVLCATTSIPASPTESRMRSAALVNHALLTVFVLSPKKSTPDTGNIRKRSLVRIRPQPALVPTPTPLVNLRATLPSPCPRQTQLLRNRVRPQSFRTSLARMASSPLKNTSTGSNRTCVCSVVVAATRPKNA